MQELTRRDFLQLGLRFGAILGVGSSFAPRLACALEEVSSGNPIVLWLQGLSCSGCSISFLNSDSPDPDDILTNYLSLAFHPTFSAATGEKSIELIRHVIEQGNYVLVVEGSVPAGMPSACMIGESTFEDLLSEAAEKAAIILTAGSCASFGGIPSAEGNPTGAVSAYDFLREKISSKPMIRIPGCPCHPDWLVGTVIYVKTFGLPELDDMSRPTMFFNRLIHDQCPRFADYEREQFAKTFSDRGCFFKLGCLGPKTYADCTLRQWNSGTNMCIKAGAPCVGCASPLFTLKKNFPLYTKK